MLRTRRTRFGRNDSDGNNQVHIVPMEDFQDTFAASLKEEIIGQDHVIEPISEAVLIHRLGLSIENKPAGIFMLLGLTGSGKTRTVEAVAKALHGDDKKFIRVDCGEMTQDHEVARLIGAPPGYIGHNTVNPVLSEKSITAVMSEGSPIAVILFDEIEKASQSMLRMLLGILDNSTMRTGDNQVVKFDNALIFMTSNIGSKSLESTYKPMGIVRKEDLLVDRDSIKVVRSEYVKHFSSEFRNRIDHVLVYNRLTEKNLREILKKEVSIAARHLCARTNSYISVTYNGEVADHIISAGSGIEFGAREIKRIVKRDIFLPMAKMYARGDLPNKVMIRMSPDGIAVTRGE